MSVDWNAFAKQATPAQLSLYSEFISMQEEKPQIRSSIKPQLILNLESALPAERLNLLTEFIQAQVQSVLGLSSKSVIDISRPLQEMGMDSLMPIEIKNRINSAIGKDLPVTAIFNYPNIQSLSEYILFGMLGMEPERRETREEKSQETTYKNGEILTAIEDLSEEAAEELLMKKLNELKAN